VKRYVIAEADGMESILQTALELLQAMDPNVAKVIVLDTEGTVIDYAESKAPAEDEGPHPSA